MTLGSQIRQKVKKGTLIFTDTDEHKCLHLKPCNTVTALDNFYVM